LIFQSPGEWKNTPDVDQRQANPIVAAPTHRWQPPRSIDLAGNEPVVMYEHAGGTMADDMGTFRIDVELENPAIPSQRLTLHSVLIDTGAELSWFPAGVLESLGIERSKPSRFRQATGTVVERWTGEARIYAAGTRTIDEVVFGEPNDLVLLGSRSLEGLNLTIDPMNKRLIDAGPAPAAATP
jgi:predicted aspartyl protease